MNEKDLELNHEFDGIKEYDSPIPLWLSFIFVGSIIFSLIYMPYYHIFHVAPLPPEEWEQENAALAVQKAQQATQPAPAMDLAALAADPAAVAEGGEIFATNCAACHGANLEGVIGPNLKDATWIHGNGTLDDIQKVVATGVLEKGMPAWESVLGASKVARVVAYIHSMQGK